MSAMDVDDVCRDHEYAADVDQMYSLALRALDEDRRFYSSTENGCCAFDSTQSAPLDLFFRYVRTVDDDELHTLLEASWETSPADTVRIILNGRDIRNGKGECQVSYHAMRWLKHKAPATYAANLPQFVETYGAYKDLLRLYRMEDGDEVELRFFAAALKRDAELPHDAPISLAAKWAPRQGKAYDHLARKIAALLFPSVPRKMERYRKLLAGLSPRLHLVETRLSEKSVKGIHYGKVPAKAHRLYHNAFVRHDPLGYRQYMDSVKAGKDQIKSIGRQPHEVVRDAMRHHSETNEQQWRDMIRRLRAEGTFGSNLAIVDVSGSMCCDAGEGFTALDVAIALGLMTVHASDAPWNGRFLTFSNDPVWTGINTHDTLANQVASMSRAHWAMSTNIEAALKKILDEAVQQELDHNQMPKTLFVFSDMQFNACVKGDTAFQTARNLYLAAGYDMPSVVFWNLSARETRGIPVTKDEHGTVLLSGYSETLMRHVMGGRAADMTPFTMLHEILEPYEPVAPPIVWN